MSKQKIIFLRGLPASGKSTWSKQFCIDNPEFVRINKDDLRIQLGNPTYSSAFENDVVGIQREMGNIILKHGKSLIIDDTNFASKHEEYWKMVADMGDYDFEIKFFDVPCEECVKRDKERENSVGAMIIRMMNKNYLKSIEDKNK